MFLDPNVDLSHKKPTVNCNNLFNLTYEHSKCLQFYYILKSNVSVNLRVQLVLGYNKDVLQTWLTVNAITNSILDWKLSKLMLPNDAYRIQLALDLITENKSQILFLIDDIFIETCTLNANNQIDLKNDNVLYWCDYEDEYCSFKNTMKI